jgi:hypothetical protein
MPYTYLVNHHPPGETQCKGAGDVIYFVPTAKDMGRYWSAIGVAVLRGAELRIVHAER